MLSASQRQNFRTTLHDNPSRHCQARRESLVRHHQREFERDIDGPGCKVTVTRETDEA